MSHWYFFLSRTNFVSPKSASPESWCDFIEQITVQVPETRTVEERSHQAARRTSNRRTAGQHSRGTRRPAYSTRAAAALDVEESAEEEAAATPSDTEEEDDEEEWSESSR